MEDKEFIKETKEDLRYSWNGFKIFKGPCPIEPTKESAKESL